MRPAFINLPHRVQDTRPVIGKFLLRPKAKICMTMFQLLYFTKYCNAQTDTDRDRRYFEFFKSEFEECLYLDLRARQLSCPKPMGTKTVLYIRQ